MSEKNIIFLFETGHIDAYKRFLEEHPEYMHSLVVALDPEIEEKLRSHNLSFVSGGAYRTFDAQPRIRAAELTSEIFESDCWKFFSYRTVSLARVYFFSLQVYLTELLYWIDIISNVFARHEAARCVVFPAKNPRPVMGSCWMEYWIRIPVDAVSLAAQARSKEVVVPPAASLVPETNKFSFVARRTLFGWGIKLLNGIVAFIRRPQRIRMLVSDYWSSVHQVLKLLDSVEVTFIDRMVALRAGLTNIWKYRLQFLHLESRSSAQLEEARAEFTNGWKKIQLPACEFRGFELKPLIIPVLESFIDESRDSTLAQIDGAYILLATKRPHVVMLRATTSAQPHFSILAQAARALRIPSLEMLHGLDYYGKGGSYRYHGAEYVAVYGELIKKQMEGIPPLDSKVVVVGSPRFDVYAQLGRASERAQDGKIVFLCIAPVAGAGDIDMYDILEYFAAVANAVRPLQNASVIIKFRPGNNRDDFVRAQLEKLFEGVSYTIAQAEPLVEVFPKADIAITCFSTAGLEAMQSGLPLVYLGLSPSQQMLGAFHFTPYAQAGAIRLLMSSEELENTLRELADDKEQCLAMRSNAFAFLKKEYAFDGLSSKRTTELIEDLARKTLQH